MAELEEKRNYGSWQNSLEMRQSDQPTAIMLVKTPENAATPRSQKSPI